jgi:hypothetical protein
MVNFRKNSPQALRFAERRRREDDAPRLRDEVENLVDLQLNVDDRAGVIEGNRYIRRVVVDRASSLFLVPCGDPRCAGEDHDLTPVVMRALHAQQTSFGGDDGCNGSVGPAPCSRILRFEAVATYRNAGVTAQG